MRLLQVHARALSRMNKREFLKTSGAIVAGSMIAPFSQSQQQPAPRENWAGNITYHTERVFTPGSVEEVRDVVKKCQKLRALGSRHSFNTIADSDANQISMQHLDQIQIDEKAHTVTVGAGIKYGQLAPVIDGRGYALHNLASLPHISVAGAIATATHGSGLHNGNLATAVSGIEFITADGQTVQLSREKDGEQFFGAVVHLGALGVLTRVTLNLLPTFQVVQSVYRNLSFDHLKDSFAGVFGAGYSVSLFTDWQNHRATQVWIKRRVTPGENYKWPDQFYSAKLATEKLHPIEGHSAEACTDQLGVPGPWYERLPHFKMNFTPSSGRELQTEYLVPQEHAYEAVSAVEKLHARITPHLFITELRTIASDDLWMSTAYQRPSLAIHFTWKPEWPDVKQILPLIEQQLAPFGPRPHWGKLFTVPPAALQAQYKQLSGFKDLAQRYDPNGKFRNEFLAMNLYS
jgi:alditol oxidase